MRLDNGSPQALRFIPAGSVESYLFDFSNLPVETRDRRRIGHLVGVVVDVVTKRLRYVVIETSRWAERALRMVPFSSATLDREDRALRLDGDLTTVDAYPEFEPQAIRPLSKDDLTFVRVA